MQVFTIFILQYLFVGVHFFLYPVTVCRDSGVDSWTSNSAFFTSKWDNSDEVPGLIFV